MITHTATIRRASHYFTIENPTRAMYPVIYRFSAQYTQVSWERDPRTGRSRYTPTKTYALYCDQGREFRFHRNQFDEFMRELEASHVPVSSYTIVDVPMYEPEKIELKRSEGWELYDGQVKAKKFVLDDWRQNPWDNRNALLMMPMGTGKTKTASDIAVDLGTRIAVFVAGKYVNKWVKDLQENLDLTRKDIVAIQGSDILQRCTLYKDSGYEIPKAFVISLQTLNIWLKIYSNDPNDPRLEAYGCKPEEFMEVLKIGMALFDEAHEQPHMVYKVCCYLNVPIAVQLTATLLTKDQILRRVQGMMFPQHRRFTEIKMKQYITSHSCVYQIYDYENSRIQTTEYGRNSYSHAAFEKSILKHKRLKRQYIEMVMKLVEDSYVKRRVPGDKLAIFVSTLVMADELVEEIQARFPNFDTRRYMPSTGDPYENAIDADIRVTTVIASGTALDIPGLRVSILLISMDSPNANMQTLGRLREIKHRTENTDVHFYYVFCSSIPKQVQYHQNKVDLYSDRILEHKKELLDTLYP